MTNEANTNQPEKNVRPFIIKSIQAIVQGRSGAKFQTSCLSNVGARNNMMINVEDDPDIGSTIKQNLGPAYIMMPFDRIHLSIILRRINCKPSLTIEIWEFELEPLKINAAKDDLFQRKCKARFLERLSTLLKAILVVNRLLPAYRLTCLELSEEYQNCYNVKLLPREVGSILGNMSSGSGDSRLPDLTLDASVLREDDEGYSGQSASTGFGHQFSRNSTQDQNMKLIRQQLGADMITHQIGSVFTNSGQNKLHVRVHYLTNVDLSQMVPIPVIPQPQYYLAPTDKMSQLQLQQYKFMHADNAQLNVVIEENDSSVMLAEEREELTSANQHTKSARKVRPAFLSARERGELEVDEAEGGDDSSPTEETHHNELPFQNLLLQGRGNYPLLAHQLSANHEETARQAKLEMHKRQLQVYRRFQRSQRRQNAIQMSRRKIEVLGERIARFSFVSNDGGANDLMADFANIYSEVKDCELHMFAGLRDIIEADQIQQEGGGQPPLPPQGSLPEIESGNPGEEEERMEDCSHFFDEEELLDELDEHERVLKEFDDFLGYFHPENITRIPAAS